MPSRAAKCPVQVAAIGCGYWGKNLVRNFAELGALAAICDPNRTAAAALADRYHAPVATVDAAQFGKSPARGGHSMVLRATRSVDDPFPRRRGALRRHRARWLLLAQDDCRRHNDAAGLSRRRAGARLRLVAASVQGTKARGHRRSRDGGVRQWAALEQ